MKSSRPPTPKFARDEHETGFTGILARLLSSTPGAIGAALVDAEGETVDYAGSSLDPFEIKVAAATLRIVLQDVDAGKLPLHGGAARRIVIRTTRRGFVLEALPEGYALLSILHRAAAFAHADRALDATLRELYLEAGWSAPPGLFRWHCVEVATSSSGKPTAMKIDVGFRPVHVIGRVAAGLQRGESGFRVGVDRGAVEVTLVRGRDDRWYADTPPEELLES